VSLCDDSGERCWLNDEENMITVSVPQLYTINAFQDAKHVSLTEIMKNLTSQN